MDSIILLCGTVLCGIHNNASLTDSRKRVVLVFRTSQSFDYFVDDLRGRDTVGIGDMGVYGMSILVVSKYSVPISV